MILEKDFLFRRYNKELAEKLPAFDCGDEDLNAFFQEDAFNYDAQLLGRSYCFLSALEGDIAAIFTLSNSAIRVAELPNNAKRRLVKLIPWVKLCISIQMPTISFPFFLRKKVKKNCIIASLRTKISKLGRCTLIWRHSCSQ